MSCYSPSSGIQPHYRALGPCFPVTRECCTTEPSQRRASGYSVICSRCSSIGGVFSRAHTHGYSDAASHRYEDQEDQLQEDQNDYCRLSGCGPQESSIYSLVFRFIGLALIPQLSPARIHHLLPNLESTDSSQTFSGRATMLQEIRSSSRSPAPAAATASSTYFFCILPTYNRRQRICILCRASPARFLQLWLQCTSF